MTLDLWQTKVPGALAPADTTVISSVSKSISRKQHSCWKAEGPDRAYAEQGEWAGLVGFTVGGASTAQR